jgi:hypothetical protein
LSGCTGTIGDTSAGQSEGKGTSSEPGGTVGPPVVAPPGTAIEEGAGLMPLRRLSQAEYRNTIESLFGAGIMTTVRFPDEPLGPSTYGTPTQVTEVERDRFEQAGDEIAARVIASLSTIAPCDAGKNERSCADAFVSVFGARIFRRPVLAAEKDALLALYDGLKAAPISDSHTDAMQTLVSAMLQSPQFLYHWELGSQAPIVEGGALRLGGYEVASRLAYFIWQTMPDDTLFTAAASGALDSADGVVAQAERLLSDSRASRMVLGMVGQWIGIGGLPALAKDSSVVTVTDPLRQAMNAEFEAFTKYALLDRGSYTELLTAPYSFVSAPLAPIYGSAAGSSATPIKTNLSEGRMGLFSQSAFLAIKALPQESSPVRRGKLVADRLLCREIPPPPPGFAPVPPPLQPGQQTREAYAEHSTNSICKACHSQMDPLGFAFEHFDAVGRYRATEVGRPIDASGTVAGLDGKDVSFKDATELLPAIANSKEGQACMVSQVTRYALGRALGDFDGAALEQGLTDFQAGSLDIRKLIPTLAKSKSFRYRIPGAGEIIQ